MSAHDRNTAVLQFLKDATGIDWIWAAQGEVRPEYPYGTIDYLSEQTVGQEHRRYTQNTDLPAGEDLEAEIIEQRVIVMSLNVFSRLDPSSHHDTHAMSYMDAVRKGVLRPSLREALREAGMVPSQVTTAQHIPELVNGKYLSRAQCDIRFIHHAVDKPESEVGSNIESIKLSSAIANAADSLELNEETIP